MKPIPNRKLSNSKNPDNFSPQLNIICPKCKNDTGWSKDDLAKLYNLTKDIKLKCNNCKKNAINVIAPASAHLLPDNITTTKQPNNTPAK